jgi:hypothetical protein
VYDGGYWIGNEQDEGVNSREKKMEEMEKKERGEYVEEI